MITETYRGRKITARALGGQDWGRTRVTINGVVVGGWSGSSEHELELLRRTIDLIDEAPVDGDRWPPHYYAPGTYELCDKGLHPREVGGSCTHSTCRALGAE